jgi:hypothetical protein
MDQGDKGGRRYGGVRGVWLKWIGTHKAYDKAIVKEVQHGC